MDRSQMNRKEQVAVFIEQMDELHLNRWEQIQVFRHLIESIDMLDILRTLRSEGMKVMMEE